MRVMMEMEENAYHRYIGRVSDDDDDMRRIDDQNEGNENNNNHDHDNDNDDEANGSDEPALELGGTIGTPAFALLVGKVVDPITKTPSPCSIPVTRLPATLGRTHSTSDPSFIPLGKHKSLSRQHFTIFYRDASGGRLGQYGEESEELVYRTKPVVKSEDGEAPRDDDNDRERVICPYGYDEEEGLPSGFFAVQCLSKNKIFVGGRKVEQGQVAMLTNETPMQIATHSLYFMLPIDSSAAGSHTIQVPNPAYEAYQKKQMKQPRRGSGTGLGLGSDTDRLHKKQRLDSHTSSTGFVTGTGTNQSSQSATGVLDSLPLDTLMSRMTDAIDSNQWDRKNQMLGSAISLHAVRDAAKSKELAKIARVDGGVCRGDVMKWIENSPIYSRWVSQMLTKMEVKSYQSNIGKALTRGGYIRTGTTGRHVRWTLPEDITPYPLGDEKDVEEEDDNNVKIKAESSDEQSDINNSDDSIDGDDIHDNDITGHGLGDDNDIPEEEKSDDNDSDDDDDEDDDDEEEDDDDDNSDISENDHNRDEEKPDVSGDGGLLSDSSSDGSEL